MASVTALQLVNRVRLYRRQPTVATFSTDEDSATLNAVNQAIEDILGTRRWEFDLRHDGQLTTRAPFTLTSVTGVKGQSTLSCVSSGAVDADFVGAYVTRVIMPTDDEYSNTAFRVNSVDAVGATTTCNMATSNPSAFSAVAGDLIYAEYMLPDTVREVVRVGYQEEEINMELLSPTTRFEEWIPNAYEERGDPQTLAIGGWDEQTHLSTGTVAPKLRAIVWPVPDDEYVLNYSYYYRHPELSAVTDVLEGVPPEVVSDIVLQATSIMAMAWDANFAMAHFGDLAQSQASAKHRAGGGSSSRRHRINSWGGSGTRVPIEVGFPNKLIGD